MMDLAETQPEQKRYFTPMQVFFGAFLGGPIGACWLLARNYEAFGEGGNAGRAMATGLAGAVVLLLAVLFLPLPEKLPPSVIAIAYSAAFQIFAQYRQMPKIVLLQADGARKHSGWRVVGIGLVSLLFVAGMGIGLGVLLGAMGVPLQGGGP